MTRIVLLLVLFAVPAWAEPSVTVAFSPGRATETVVDVIGSAQKTIHLAAYSFTSKPIAQALIDASRRGVKVEAVLDRSNEAARSTQAGTLVAAGIPIRIDYRYAIMHDKFLVVDGVTVETGSFNYTKQAGSNAENVIVLREAPEIAVQYEAEWSRLWNESEPWSVAP